MEKYFQNSFKNPTFGKKFPKADIIILLNEKRIFQI